MAIIGALRIAIVVGRLGVSVPDCELVGMPSSPLSERKSVPWGIRKSFGAVNHGRNWRDVACRD
jgi:hypothetical protein